MKKYLIISLMFSLMPLSLSAKPIAKEQLPAKILEHFNKKHPVVTNFTAEDKVHFRQNLIEINFKEEKKTKVLDEEAADVKPVNVQEESAVFYRADGHFFVNAEKVYAFNIFPDYVYASLKTAFADYKITAAQLIPNPNGPGEEYEVMLNSRGHQWAVSLDHKGVIISREDRGLLPASE